MLGDNGIAIFAEIPAALFFTAGSPRSAELHGLRVPLAAEVQCRSHAALLGVPCPAVCHGEKNAIRAQLQLLLAALCCFVLHQTHQLHSCTITLRHSQ